MELPAHRTAPSGSAAARTGQTAPSNGSSRPASQVLIASPATRSASAQSAVQAGSTRPSCRPASRATVSTGSACTKVAGTSAASRQPSSPSTITSSGQTRESISVTGFDVGMAPVRMTRSGAWASIHGPGRASWSARAMTSPRSCGPVRRPDRGSARIGKPVASASRASAAGRSGSSSGPAMIMPRSPAPAAPPAPRARRRPASGARPSPRRRARPQRRAQRQATGVSRGPSGSSGSRNGTLTCTGPAGPAAATATARPATHRQCASVTGSPSNGGSSVNHFAARPNRWVWLIAWGAPRSRSSAGRSAVSTTSGTRASCASTTAGASSTTAVPDVARRTTGRREVRAMPSAKNPAARSS